MKKNWYNERALEGYKALYTHKIIDKKADSVKQELNRLKDDWKGLKWLSNERMFSLDNTLPLQH
jgi:hypothetical protein